MFCKPRKIAESGSRNFLSVGEENICDDKSETERYFSFRKIAYVPSDVPMRKAGSRPSLTEVEGESCDDINIAVQSTHALVAELVYARALGARSERIRGSSPLGGTLLNKKFYCIFILSDVDF